MARRLVDYVIDNRFTRPARAALERRAFAWPPIRAWVNGRHNRTNAEGRIALYHRSAKIFRGHDGRFKTGVWDIDVPPFRLRMPLRPEQAWLDWDTALSALGHDAEIKDFYASILTSDLRPDLFCDIGANYGVHTFLMRSAGVPALAFEPNPACAEYFHRLEQLNGFDDVRREPIALGDFTGTARLTFPETETWLGTIHMADDLVPPEVSGATIETPVKRLDDLAIEAERCLVKIDAEGSELRVIRGGRRFLADCSAFVVFESNRAEDRAELFDEFTRLGFSIEGLPMPDIQRSQSLARDAFLAAPGVNFVARNLASGRRGKVKA